MPFYVIYSRLIGRYLAGLMPPQQRPRWVAVEEGAAAAVILYAAKGDANNALAHLRKAFPQDPNLKSAVVFTFMGDMQ